MIDDKVKFGILSKAVGTTAGITLNNFNLKGGVEIDTAEDENGNTFARHPRNQKKEFTADGVCKGSILVDEGDTITVESVPFLVESVDIKQVNKGACTASITATHYIGETIVPMVAVSEVSDSGV